MAKVEANLKVHFVIREQLLVKDNLRNEVDKKLILIKGESTK